MTAEARGDVHTDEGHAFEIVVICTGNRFRSPLAESLLRNAAATGGLPVRIRSAGTMELGSAAVLEEALEAAGKYGADLSAHRARSLAGEDLSRVDLILGFERSHVATAVIEAAASRERTFTLPHLVSLLDQVSVPERSDAIERARTAVALADHARASASSPFDMPELHDPIGRSAREQREIASEVHLLTKRLVPLLFGRYASGTAAS
jgi:protein-tyrosine phosphatase